jgi:glutaredoxin
MRGSNDPLFLYIQEKTMEITIYTSNGCQWCDRMKELMERANQEYDEYVWQELDGDTQVEIAKQYPQMRSFPVAIIDGEYSGGLIEVANRFLYDVLVSSSS